MFYWFEYSGFTQPWYNIGRLFRELGQHNDSMAALHRCQQLTLRDLNIKGADAVLGARRPASDTMIAPSVQLIPACVCVCRLEQG